MKNLKKIRKAHNQSQEYVAKKINVSKSTYSKYESGNIPISSDKLLQLVHHFDVSADYLLDLGKYPVRASHLHILFELYDDYLYTLKEDEENEGEVHTFTPHEYLSAEEHLERIQNFSSRLTYELEGLKEKLYGNESDENNNDGKEDKVE